MPAITAKSLREKTTGELQDQLLLEKKKLFDGIVKGASGEAIKAHEKRIGRRLVARIQSILSERTKRVELDAAIKALTPKAEKADAKFVKLIKGVDERAAAIKAELAKPVGERKVKPQLKHIRTKQFCPVELSAQGGANRNAVRLAEARRVRHGLDREDMGSGR
ncbi:MAG TPA: 50S ribosomal protein L29 [Planctomycetota bacterium]|nr:50S ribosomal protein L29 [Planctomycetota bacterium]